MPGLLGLQRVWVKVNVIVGHLFPDFCINDTYRFNKLSKGELGVLFYSLSVATDFNESTQYYQQLRPPLFWPHITGRLVPDVFVDILTIKDETSVMSQCFEHHSPRDVAPHPSRIENSTTPWCMPGVLPTFGYTKVLMARN